MDRPCPPLTVCLLLWLRHRGPGTEPVHGPGSPLRHGQPQYPALLPIKWGSRPAALGGVGVRCHVGGHRPRSAAHPGPRTAACGRGCSSWTACSTLWRCPDTRLAGFLKVPEIKDGKRFYEIRQLSRANPHSDPTTPLGVGHAGAPRGRAGRGEAAPTPCSVTRPLGDVGL